MSAFSVFAMSTSSFVAGHARTTSIRIGATVQIASSFVLWLHCSATAPFDLRNLNIAIEHRAEHDDADGDADLEARACAAAVDALRDLGDAGRQVELPRLRIGERRAAGRAARVSRERTRGRAKPHLESSCHLDRLSAPECLIAPGKSGLQPRSPGTPRPGSPRPPQPCTDMEKNGKRSLEMIVDACVQRARTKRCAIGVSWIGRCDIPPQGVMLSRRDRAPSPSPASGRGLGVRARLCAIAAPSSAVPLSRAAGEGRVRRKPSPQHLATCAAAKHALSRALALNRPLTTLRASRGAPISPAPISETPP